MAMTQNPEVLRRALNQFSQELQQVKQSNMQQKLGEGGAAFEQVFNQVHGMQEHERVLKARYTSMSEPVRKDPITRLDDALKGQEESQSQLPTAGEVFSTFVHRMSRSQETMDAAVALALSGKHIDAFDVGDLQVAVFLRTQELALASKVVENAKSGAQEIIEVKV